MRFKIETHYIDIFDPAIGQRMDAYWYKSTRKWRVPKTLGALRELYVLTNDQEVRNIALEMRAKQKELSGIKELPLSKELIPYKRINKDMNNYDKWISFYPDGYLKLTPEQERGVKFGVETLKEYGHVFYFDDPRTGKTFKTTATMDKLNLKKVVVAQLGNVLDQFKADIEDWQTINRKVITLDGTVSKQKRLEIYKKFSMSDAMVLVMSYDTITNDLEEILETTPDLLVCDEPHKKIKNASKRKFKAIRKVAKHSRYLIMLTGTPIDNLKQETFVYLSIAMPKTFGSQEAFKVRYFEMEKKTFGKIQVKSVGGWKKQYEIIELFDSRATNEKSFLERPKIEYINIPLSSRQEKIIEEIETSGEIKMDRKEVFEVWDPILEQNIEVKTKWYPVKSPLTARLLTRQALVGVSALKGMEAKKVSPKLKYVLKYILKNPDRKILIFTDHKKFMSENEKYFKKLGIKYAYIHGGIKNAERDVIRKQLNNGELQVVMGQTLTMSTGGTFNEAQDIFFLNLPYNPSERRQASDRLLDFTDEANEGKRVMVLQHPGTMDEDNKTTLDEKVENQKVVNNFANEKQKLIVGGK